MKSAAILAFGGASGGVLTTRESGKRSPSGTPALAAEPAQADRFSKARSARSASMLEDYTELIADLIAASGEARTTDIARRMGVAHPTASKTIARLKREGLARAQPYRGIFLTEASAARGGGGRRRGHRALCLRRDAARLRGVPARPRRSVALLAFRPTRNPLATSALSGCCRPRPGPGPSAPAPAAAGRAKRERAPNRASSDRG